MSTKYVQAKYYDRASEEEFEIERPWGAGRLYEFLLGFKFQLGMDLLDEPLAGRSVLAVCCGAGMDVEFLARCGARVTGLDISTGALRAAQERRRRHAFWADFVAGDAEQLPFFDATFDYCYVHDGLHHLDEPSRALAELGRLARYGVVVTEPAAAALTTLAIRLHLIPAFEEAGNYVVRFTPAALAAAFRSRGFSEVKARRYLMKYPHQPNWLFRVLSRPVAFALARAVFLLVGDRLLARFGNKVTVAAKRPASKDGPPRQVSVRDPHTDRSQGVAGLRQERSQ